MKSTLSLTWSVWLLAAVGGALAGECTITVLDDATGKVMPARVHLLNERNQAQRGLGLPFWFDHSVCPGTARFELVAGQFHFAVERGPEFSAAQGSFSLASDGKTNLTVRLNRITDLAKEGWWSGETHVHRGLADAELLMQAEDLHVGQFITWWNKVNPWSKTALPSELPVRFDGDRYYHALGGEDERDGGALLYLDLRKPLEITNGARFTPLSLTYAHQGRQSGAHWIDAEKPFWWDFPLWVAHGVADTVGIANNHMQRGGMMGNEAWGKPRDPIRFPGPQGNGRWTQEIYYHALNCGLHLPPSAGSASGVLPNPVGYNRVYVHVDGVLSYEKWKEGLLAGRSFVSNGPLLRVRANGQFPGHTFNQSGPLRVSIQGDLKSRDPIQTVELIQNGKSRSIKLPAEFTVTESGWFLVRAVADLTNTFRFASTAPWYVELDQKPMKPVRESAQFFIDWCQERSGSLSKQPSLSAEERDAFLQPWREARRFWEARR